MGSPNPGQLGYRVLTLLPSTWVGGHPHHRPSLWRIQQYEEGTTEETRKVDLDSIEEHRVAALM
jgi:hypothetical protein